MNNCLLYLNVSRRFPPFRILRHCRKKTSSGISITSLKTQFDHLKSKLSPNRGILVSTEIYIVYIDKYKTSSKIIRVYKLFVFIFITHQTET